MPAGLLILLYLALAVSPLVFAWIQGLEPRTIFDELATGLGLVALAMIMAEFLLLGRFRTVTNRVGTDVVMRSHQLLARAALVFALAHPFFYISPRSPAPAGDVTRQSVVDPSWFGNWPGILAWLLLVGLVAKALAKEITGLRYEHWRLLHGLMAALVTGFGTLHALRAGALQRGPGAGNALDRASGADARGAGLCIPAGPAQTAYEAMAGAGGPQGRGPDMVPDPDPGLQRHAALPRRAIRLAQYRPVGLFAGGKPVLHLLGPLPRTGGSIPDQGAGRQHEPHRPDRVRHPRMAGGAAWPPDDRRTWRCSGYLLHRGGRRVRSAYRHPARVARARRSPPHSTGLRQPPRWQIVFDADLADLEKHHGTEIIHVLSEPPPGWTGETGRITPDMLQRVFAAPERRNWLYVLCGPPGMIRSVEDTLIGMGVPASNILSEQFVYD